MDVLELLLTSLVEILCIELFLQSLLLCLSHGKCYSKFPAAEDDWLFDQTRHVCQQADNEEGHARVANLELGLRLGHVPREADDMVHYEDQFDLIEGVHPAFCLSGARLDPS